MTGVTGSLTPSCRPEYPRCLTSWVKAQCLDQTMAGQIMMRDDTILQITMIDDTILHEMRNDITAKEIPAAAFGTPRLTAGAGRRGVETDTAEVAVRSFTGVE